MRLVCPNCEAKYEVPEDAIPETGRDVQCANCGHAWYQMRPRAAETAAAVTPPVAAPAPVAAPVAEPTPPEPEPEPAPPEPVTAASPEPEPVAEEPVVEAAPVTPEPMPEADPEPTAESAEAPAEADVEPVAVPSEDTSAAETAVEAVAEAAPVAAEEAEVVAEPVADPVAEADDDDKPAPEAPPAAAAGAAAYAVDESVLAILREEADREAKARAAEAGRALETQTDLGVDEAIPDSRRAPDPVAEDTALAAGRARLPDVEEINSTLRPAEAAVEDTPPEMLPAANEGRSSFRSGFLLVMTVAILGSAIYGSADAISGLVPSLADPLKSYVGLVDSLRLQLDGLMQSATVAINGT